MRFFLTLMTPLLVLLLAVLTFADPAEDLQHCVSEYNNLLSQCQGEINRAAAETAGLSEALQESKLAVEIARGSIPALFSWRFLRAHFEHFLPSLKKVEISTEKWAIVEGFVNREIRERTLFLFKGPLEFLTNNLVEDFLLFWGISFWIIARITAMFFGQKKVRPPSPKGSRR